MEFAKDTRLSQSMTTKSLYPTTNNTQNLLELVDFSNPHKLKIDTNSNQLFSSTLPIGDITQFSGNGLLSFDIFTMPAMPSKSSILTINNLIANFGIENNQNTNQLWDIFNLALQNPIDGKPADNTGSAGSKKVTKKDYGNYTHKITTLYNGSAEDLNKKLKGVLANKGEKLLELQEKYGLSASVLAAIAIHESANGTSNAAKNKNNICGMMSKESNWKELATFSSVDECLEAMAKNLKNNYVDKGLVTISQIHEKYCPIGAENDPTGLNKNWGNGVASLTNKLENVA